MTFKNNIHTRYRITALDKSISQMLIDDLKKTEKNKQQASLDSFVLSEGITGDDLSDLMYDLGKAGFHSLKKPESSSGGGASELILALKSGKVDTDLGRLLADAQEAGSSEIQEVYDYFRKNPEAYGKFIDAAEKHAIGFYDRQLDKVVPITKKVLEHVSNDYILDSILYSSVYGQKKVTKEAIMYAFERLGNPIKAYENYTGGHAGQLLEVAYGNGFDEKLDKWFGELDDDLKEDIRKQWDGSTSKPNPP